MRGGGKRHGGALQPAAAKPAPASSAALFSSALPARLPLESLAGFGVSLLFSLSPFLTLGVGLVPRSLASHPVRCPPGPVGGGFHPVPCLTAPAVPVPVTAVSQGKRGDRDGRAGRPPPAAVHPPPPPPIFSAWCPASGARLTGRRGGYRG